jgi:hypothetical protein
MFVLLRGDNRESRVRFRLPPAFHASAQRFSATRDAAAGIDSSRLIFR